MTVEELRAAAERYRKGYPRASKSMGADYVSPYLHKDELRDMETLAEACASLLLSPETEAK
jgi:hypothetical protein